MTDHTSSPSDASADADADRAEPTANESAAGADGPITVLQVEPDARSAELLEAFAARLTDRIRVRSVGRVAEAVDAVEGGVEVDGERVGVDRVVTEQRLPDGGGVDLAERLRGADRGLPVVFHTTCPREEREAAAFGAGADAYFEKGADRGRFDAILNRIRALVDEGRERGKGAERAAASTPRAFGSPGETLRSEE
ncbi:response regulator [Halorubrum sodomense]|uniref:CheY chemotaxis protein or a CheY-like REC (Receiver) domain n=1 Tax=Halorubrum sodomense TaxID=35743 RepID=A0A1I6FLP0_HALSD|nr:response regulator [Halorubrum sodomense]SFR30727.1 CheY chemotaxis protein or a CheY-like REC (receiver) domain [Halorubrum sodomense]